MFCCSGVECTSDDCACSLRGDETWTRHVVACTIINITRPRYKYRAVPVTRARDHTAPTGDPGRNTLIKYYIILYNIREGTCHGWVNVIRCIIYTSRSVRFYGWQKRDLQLRWDGNNFKPNLTDHGPTISCDLFDFLFKFEVALLELGAQVHTERYT